MTHGRRWAIRIAAIVAVFGFVLPGGFVWWLGSSSGRGWISEKVQSLSDGHVRVQGLAGHPLRSWQAERIDVQTPGMKLTIDKIEVRWRPWRLLGGTLHLDHVHFASSLLQQKPAAQDTQPSQTLWPQLVLQNLVGDRLRIDRKQQDELILSGIRLRHFRVTDELSGELQMAGRMGSLGAQLHARIKGRMSRWKLETELASDEAGRLQVELSGSKRPEGRIKLRYGLKQWPKLTAEGGWRIAPEERQMRLRWQAGASPLSGPLDGMLALSQEPAGGKLNLDFEASSGRLRANWRLAGTTWQGGIKLDQWQLPLRHPAPAVKGRIAASGNLADNRWMLDHAELQTLGLNMEIEGGGKAREIQLHGRLEGADLKDLFAWQGIRGGGALKAQWKLAGDIGHPEFSWEGEARQLVMAGWHAAGVHGSGSFRAAALSASFNVRGDQLSRGKLGWPVVRFSGDLLPEAIRFNGDGTGLMPWSFRLVASKDQQGWQGVVEHLWFGRHKDLVAVQGLPFVWREQGLSLPQHAWRLLDQSVSTRGELGRKLADLHLSVPAFNVAVLRPWLGDYVRDVSGFIHADMHLTGGLDDPQIALEASSDILRLNLLQAEEKAAPARLEALRLKLVLDKGMISWDADMHLGPNAPIHVDGSQPWRLSLVPLSIGPPGKAGVLRVDMEIRDLSDMSPWLPMVDPLAGSAKVHVVMREPMLQPIVSGEVKLALERFGLPEFGLLLHGNGSLVIEESGERGRIQLAMQGDTGRLSMEGPLSLREGSLPRLELSHFPLLNTAEQKLVANGYLAARLHQGWLWIEGNVKADPLSFVVPESRPMPTSDLVWEQSVSESRRMTQLQRSHLNVTLSLGDEAKISGRGMDLQLGGSLQLRGSLAHPELYGDVQIRAGGLDYRNIHLDILDGSHVVFSGDPDRPQLYVRAGRRIGEILVGVEVNGPVDRPESRLFSSPQMSQAEIMAYLATGRPLASLGQEGAADAVSLAGFLLGSSAGQSGIQDKLRNSLGLDELEVVSSGEQTKVTVGKKLGKRAKVRLEETVAEENTMAVTLEYQLRWGMALFVRQVQNLAPTIGLRYSRHWQGPAIGPDDR